MGGMFDEAVTVNRRYKNEVKKGIDILEKRNFNTLLYSVEYTFFL